jgi:hypothetical protein
MLSKRCRFCGVPVVAGERFCSPNCRLTAVGRSELAVKEDVTAGWALICKQARQLWHND